MFLMVINRLSEPTYFQEKRLEIYFETNVEKLPIMCKYRDVQQNSPMKVRVYLV